MGFSCKFFLKPIHWNWNGTWKGVEHSDVISSSKDEVSYLGLKTMIWYIYIFERIMLKMVISGSKSKSPVFFQVLRCYWAPPICSSFKRGLSYDVRRPFGFCAESGCLGEEGGRRSAKDTDLWSSSPAVTTMMRTEGGFPCFPYTKMGVPRNKTSKIWLV